MMTWRVFTFKQQGLPHISVWDMTFAFKVGVCISSHNLTFYAGFWRSKENTYPFAHQDSSVFSFKRYFYLVFTVKFLSVDAIFNKYFIKIYLIKSRTKKNGFFLFCFVYFLLFIPNYYLHWNCLWECCCLPFSNYWNEGIANSIK